jgi:hypothetical protein
MPQTREEFQKRAQGMANDLAIDLVEWMMKGYDALTSSELNDLDTDDKPFLLVRSMGMVVGSDAVDKRFNVEAIKKLNSKVRKILNKRGV